VKFYRHLEFHPRTCHEDSEGEYRYSCVLGAMLRFEMPLTDTKQFPYLAPINTRRHSTQFIRSDNQAPRILVFLLIAVCDNKVSGYAFHRS